MEWIQITADTVLPDGKELLVYDKSLQAWFTAEVNAQDRTFSLLVGHYYGFDQFSHYCIVTPPVEDHTPAYYELLAGIFYTAIMTKALPLITLPVTEGKITWRGVHIYEEEAGQYVRRAWLQQRETRISPVVEFDLSTGKYSLTE